MFESPTIAEFLAQSNLASTWPGAFLMAWTLVLVIVDLFAGEERKHWTPILACIGLGISFLANIAVYSLAESQQVALYGMFIADEFTGFLNMVILVATLIAVLMSWDYLNRADIHRGEFYVLALLSSAGAMFMVGANDLIIVFVALELLSIPLYILAAFRSIKNDGSELALKSEESGMKYFILGAFSSAFLVFGAALVYGATGTTNIPQIFELAGGIVGATSSATFYLLVGTALLIGWLGLQSGGCALPHVDARCLRRRAHPGHRFHERYGEGRRLRGAAARFDYRPLSAGSGGRRGGGLAGDRDHHRHPDAGAGQLRRDIAAESQAHAGIFVDRARRLYHGGGRRRRQSECHGRGDAGRAGLHAGLYVHQSWRICRGDDDRARRWQRRQYR